MMADMIWCMHNERSQGCEVKISLDVLDELGNLGKMQVSSRMTYMELVEKNMS